MGTVETNKLHSLASQKILEEQFTNSLRIIGSSRLLSGVYQILQTHDKPNSLIHIRQLIESHGIAIRDYDYNFGDNHAVSEYRNGQWIIHMDKTAQNQIIEHLHELFAIELDRFSVEQLTSTQDLTKSQIREITRQNFPLFYECGIVNDEFSKILLKARFNNEYA